MGTDRSATGQRAADAADAEVPVQNGEHDRWGSSMTTDTAIAEPQSVAFCWKNVCRPIGKVKTLLDLMNTKQRGSRSRRPGKQRWLSTKCRARSAPVQSPLSRRSA
jgi:hypothetical protein